MIVLTEVACVTDESKPRYSIYRGLLSSVTQASVKVASHKLVNLYHEFTNWQRCWNGEVSQVKYSC